MLRLNYSERIRGNVRYVLGSDVLEMIYHNELTLEAALMELPLQVGAQGMTEMGENICGALHSIGENAGYIK